MTKQGYHFDYEIYESIDELTEDDKWLLDEAREVTQHAYAPYSRFQVGAVALLSNGEIIAGSNQENASFPAGLCAERVVLASCSSLYPKVPIKTMAISYFNNNGESNHPISPCGICRQALQEFTEKTNTHIRLILGGMNGKVFIIPEASMMLPLSFTSKDLQ
ncbi:MAG: cytidine deaminase [Chitinophagaceae bacterium]|jgi:cytidine deaminase|nr:cytidine deaminase [Chitinophagaceae bacterium]